METTRDLTAYKQERDKPFRHRDNHHLHGRRKTNHCVYGTLRDSATDIEVNLADTFDEG
jgi:hypothetical protein